MCPAWLLVAVLVVGVARGAVGQCWEHLSCREPNSESSMKVTHTPLNKSMFSQFFPTFLYFLTRLLLQDCIQLCRSDLTDETPVVPGNAHLQPPPPSEPSSSSFLLPSSSSSPQAKRSYSMEHFRWGKPVGRKRRPVKVYTSNGVEDESAEAFPGDMRRQTLAGELLAAAQEEQEVMEEEEEEEEEERLVKKKDGPYKMKHFRWNGPPGSKRYGGFMKSWDQRSQRPLLTLLRNVINKDGQQQK
ncbi:pro-opiomelanocortin-like [Sander vitreus]